MDLKAGEAETWRRKGIAQLCSRELGHSLTLLLLKEKVLPHEICSPSLRHSPAACP